MKNYETKKYGLRIHKLRSFSLKIRNPKNYLIIGCSRQTGHSVVTSSEHYQSVQYIGVREHICEIQEDPACKYLSYQYSEYTEKRNMLLNNK